MKLLEQVVSYEGSATEVSTVEALPWFFDGYLILGQVDFENPAHVAVWRTGFLLY